MIPSEYFFFPVLFLSFVVLLHVTHTHTHTHKAHWCVPPPNLSANVCLAALFGLDSPPDPAPLFRPQTVTSKQHFTFAVFNV